MKHETGLSEARGRLRVLGLFIAGSFLLVAFALLYWTIIRGSSILDREDNPRLVLQELNVRRGKIFDVYNQVLAETTGEPGSLQRVYPIPEIGPAVGYYSFRHGTTGVEEGLDSELRGQGDNPWESWWHNDVLHEEVLGRDVRLTLDARWQKAANDLLGDLRGSAILFTIPDFAIRAMASTPGYDPNLLDESFESLTQDERAPLLNRVTQGLYQPGLVVAPFILAQTLADGLVSLDDPVVNADQTVPLNGSFLSCDQAIDGESNWRKVLQNHCPHPFTELASRIGEAGLLNAYQSFGLFEAPQLPIETNSGEGRVIESLGLAGIGQDSQTISPLQMAGALATLANSGQMPQFTLVLATQNESGDWEITKQNNSSKDVIPARVAKSILGALPVNQGISEYAVLALSGPEGSTNSWYLGLTPVSAPRYGVVVVVEDTDGQFAADQIGQALLKLALHGGPSN